MDFVIPFNKSMQKKENFKQPNERKKFLNSIAFLFLESPYIYKYKVGNKPMPLSLNQICLYQ